MLPFLLMLVVLGNAPVSLTTPVRANQLATLTGSTYQNGLLATDAILLKTPNGFELQYPLFTAVLNGDTLTVDLLGSDHELVITTLGYHDQTPYDLFVRMQVITCDADGFIQRTHLSSVMSKDAFDEYEAKLPPNHRIHFTRTHRPLVAGYPIKP